MTALLAGCAAPGGTGNDGDDGSGPGNDGDESGEGGGNEPAGTEGRYASFDAAFSAAGNKYEPVDAESDVQLKLLAPANPMNASEGTQDIVVLLYDAEAETPLMDASFAIETRMPEMGHGTSDEEAPAHDAHGVYVGQTTFSMPGKWIVNLDVDLASGEALAFEVNAHVGGGSGGMDHGDMDHSEPSYDSFDEAFAAHGVTHEPVNASGMLDLELKLLTPMDASNVTTGQHPIIVLLYDASSESPVTDANVSLASRMPAMDHGAKGEMAPMHVAHGEYHGHTNHTMEGEWIVAIGVTFSTGESYDFELAFDVASASDEDDGGMGHHDH